MIRYIETAMGLSAEQLEGFFVGWPDPPSPETHLRLLGASTHVVLAVEAPSDRVVGFVTANSDGVLAAHVPLLEVLPEHHGRGIGSELMRRMLARLEHVYMVDLVCDPGLEGFYSRLGLRPLVGMVARNRASLPGDASRGGCS